MSASLVGIARELLPKIALELQRIEIWRLLAICKAWNEAVLTASAVGVPAVAACSGCIHSSFAPIFASKESRSAASPEGLWILLELQEQVGQIFSSLVPRSPTLRSDGGNHLLLTKLGCSTSGEVPFFESEAAEWDVGHSDSDGPWAASWRSLSSGAALLALHLHSDPTSGPSVGPQSLLALWLLLQQHGNAILVEARLRTGRLGRYWCEQKEWRLRYTSDPAGSRGCRADVGRLAEFSLTGACLEDGAGTAESATPHWSEAGRGHEQVGSSNYTVT
ncbi:unnamed protein product [Polarella glacialis]|uniref:Uncharacterized protein n=1 Tax=Polarella glacialis TaxID=89957 RepID=A0A813F2Y2_POLGL|nr:unnamed protein product [Polarella glacialis]